MHVARERPADWMHSLSRVALDIRSLSGGVKMKKIATVFALWLLALMPIKEGFGQQGDVTVIENQATAQIRSALEKINNNEDLVKQVVNLIKKIDRDGIRQIFIANGAPSYTTISTLVIGPYEPVNKIQIFDCTFGYAPNDTPSASLSCTIGW
jgi:hypothetical protein